MKDLIETMASLALSVFWMAGVVLAAGWWKALAVFFPPYALYLCAERAMQFMGVL